MRIIELTRLNDDAPIFVSVDKICYCFVQPTRGYTWIVMGRQDFEIQVKETPEQITELIKNAVEL